MMFDPFPPLFLSHVIFHYTLYKQAKDSPLEIEVKFPVPSSRNACLPGFDVL